MWDVGCRMSDVGSKKRVPGSGVRGPQEKQSPRNPRPETRTPTRTAHQSLNIEQTLDATGMIHAHHPR